MAYTRKALVDAMSTTLSIVTPQTLGDGSPEGREVFSEDIGSRPSIHEHRCKFLNCILEISCCMLLQAN